MNEGMGSTQQPAKRQRKTAEERKLELEQKIAEVNEQAKQKTNALKAQLARLQKADRAKDTRRKILVGAFTLHAWENNLPITKEAFNRFLTKESDRALFDNLNG